MFYSQYILAKKGPLGTIWIAAHLERKLRKNQVADTDIPLSVDSILFPDVPIALRLSSHLLLGVVRIYSKKVGYLFDDCSDALLKVKQAFRSTAVDLPPEESTAPYHSITLPETFDLDDFELPDTHFFQGDYVDHHVSSREQITLQDTMEGVVFSTSQFGLDERFGDGDTSGLDLDEGLLENAVRNGDTVGQAQAPSTPVMAEEPNIQEASICDDHHELEDEDEPNLSNTHHQDLEDYNTPKLPSTENLTRETSGSDFHSGKENGTMSGSLSPTGINSDDGQQNNTDNPLKSSMSDLMPFPPPLDPLTKDPVEEAMSPQVSAEYSMDGGVNVEIQNKVTDNDDDQQVTGQLDPKTTLQNDELSLEEPHDSNGEEGVKNLEKCVHVDDPNVELPIRNYPDNSECRATEDPDNLNISSSFDPERVAISFNHVLKPCSHQDQQNETIPESNLPVSPHSQSGVPERCPGEALGNDEEKRPPGLPMEFQVEDNQPEFFNLNDQHENVTTREPHLDITNEISELPTPENFLSLPKEGHVDDQVHLLRESTPNGENLISENVEDGTSNIAGKKRSFTDSTLTIDSMNSFESFGVVQSKRTKGSVPADDDLLSSILVGKSSFLKLKPTPPPERTSKKRPRSTTRTVSSKKKVLVDDNMVLHGDQIRQQLINTGDIRRIRKKAPCTRSEIWMIQKEYLDEEIFTEPIFTGFSSTLTSIYSQEFDLSDINLISPIEAQSKIQEAIRNDTPVQDDTDPDKETEKEVNHECNPVGSDPGAQSPIETQSEIQEAIPIDSPVQADTDPDKETEKELNHESNPVGSDTGAQSPERQQHEDKTPSESLPTDGKMVLTADFIDATIVNESESTFPVDPFSVDSKEEAPTVSINLLNGVQLEEDPMREDETQLETQFVEREASIANEKSSDKVDNVTVGNEFRLEGNEVDVAVVNGENVINGDDLVERFVANYFDEAMEDFSKNEFVEVTKENENLEFEINVPDPIVEEVETEPVETRTHDAESLNHGHKKSNFQNEMDPENTFVDYSTTMEHSDFENNINRHDTGFLNDDDDEIADEGEDCEPSGAENTGFIDNSGWSSRTRAVAKYLQVLFDKEAEQGRKTLPMNNLLIGKSRKEASRMFFEALVLKTRDYIHIEQADPFDNINMKPRVKLMKSDF